MASLVFRGFGAGKGGVVRFPQFITALSTTTRGSVDQRIACETWLEFILYSTPPGWECLSFKFLPPTLPPSFTSFLPPSLPPSLTVVFRLYDCDGDGYVSREDVEKMVEAMYQMVGPLLAQERDGKGEEERKIDEVGALVSERVKEIFQILDKVKCHLLLMYNMPVDKYCCL